MNGVNPVTHVLALILQYLLVSSKRTGGSTAMVSRKVTPWLVGMVFVIVAGLASTSPVEAVASITFDQVVQGGTLSYTPGGPLVGTDILFDFFVVAGTGGTDGVYACVGCNAGFHHRDQRGYRTRVSVRERWDFRAYGSGSGHGNSDSPFCCLGLGPVVPRYRQRWRAGAASHSLASESTTRIQIWPLSWVSTHFCGDTRIRSLASDKPP